MNNIINIFKIIIKISTSKIKDNFLKPLYAKYKYKERFNDLSSPTNHQRIIIFCIPEHSNIGDHAITIAENQFLKDYFFDFMIIEIPDMLYTLSKNNIAKHIKKNDIIVIHGGGFLGTLWEFPENELRDIIKTFSKNKIIIFPQTIFFENTAYGEKELAITKEIWQNHKNLTVCLRERNSYEFVKSRVVGGHFKNVFLIPDIVLYLNKTSHNRQRSGILFCFRQDKEKVFDKNEYENLVNYITKYSEEVRYTDTVIDKTVTANDRSREVERKLNEFKRSKLVITDRLHGMIFAAITSTPCIALNNVSKKVEGVYEWIKDLDYIVFAENSDDVYKNIDRLLNMGRNQYNNDHLKPYFDKLADIVIGKGV